MENMQRNLQPAFNLIKEFEGCRLTAYADVVGRLTIGWGHANGVIPGEVITQEQADMMLTQDVEAFAAQISQCVTALMTDNQFCAFVSFAYNVGIGAFKGSTMLRDFNSKLPLETVAAQFMLWIHAGGQVLPGLVKRRTLEKNLFLS